MGRIQNLMKPRRDDRTAGGPSSRGAARKSIGLGTLARPLRRLLRASRRRVTTRNGAIVRRERILEAIGSGAEQLLRSTDPQRLSDFLAVLGKATDASRVYIFENFRDERGVLAAAHRFEWVTTGVPPQIDNPELQVAHYDWGMARWKGELSRGNAVIGRVTEFPSSERKLLSQQNIRSLVVLPVFIGSEWWGFIGFDETRYYRRWSAAEVSALKTSAGLVAASIERDRADERMQQLQRARVEGEGVKAAERRSRFLAEASRIFGSTLKYEAIFEQLARLAVPELGEWCIIDILRADEIHRVAVEHAEPRDADLARSIRRSLLPRDPSNPIVDTLETGKGRVVQRLTDTMLLEPLPDGDAAFGERPALVVPLRARGRVVGAMTLLRGEGERYQPTDLAFVESVAGRASLGLENARLYAKARRATRVRDEMLAVVSHDLRNPLNTISLSVGVLKDTPPEEEETRLRQIEIIDKSMEQSDRLIRDLLDVARMEAGKFALERERVSSETVAREALELHRGQALAKAQQLIGQVAEGLPEVWADHDRLLQVFGNLLGNAIRFTPESGEIEIGAKASAAGRVRFHVRDTGRGIRDDQLPHLFDPFWQAAHKGEGAGLGLAIARGIVEAHGGRIHAHSEMGTGTTISFTIPTAEQAEPPGEEEPAQASEPERREAAD